MADLKFKRVTRDYWNVYDGDRMVGQIDGGGPTAATKYKAISQSNVAMNPDEAPAAGYGYTKEQAAEFLVARTEQGRRRASE